MLSKERKKASIHSPAYSAADFLEGSPLLQIWALNRGRGRPLGTGHWCLRNGRPNSEISRNPNLLLMKFILLRVWRLGWGEGCIRHSEPVGLSGVFMKMKSDIQHSATLSPSVVKNRNCQDSACLNISLFSRLNLERSSFTFSNLYDVALCFQKL